MEPIENPFHTRLESTFATTSRCKTREPPILQGNGYFLASYYKQVRCSKAFSNEIDFHTRNRRKTVTLALRRIARPAMR
jgi:hypothetical protein